MMAFACYQSQSIYLSAHIINLLCSADGSLSLSPSLIWVRNPDPRSQTSDLRGGIPDPSISPVTTYLSAQTAFLQLNLLNRLFKMNDEKTGKVADEIEK